MSSCSAEGLPSSLGDHRRADKQGHKSITFQEDRSGRLYVFEGPDGVGKTSIVRRTAARLSSAGTSCTTLAFPGNIKGTLGELVYRVHHDPTSVGISLDHPLALQLLHVAAHVDAIDNQVRPALRKHQAVLLDRYWWSAWVYGNVAGVAEDQLATAVAVEKQVWMPTKPAAVFCILSGPPDDGPDSATSELRTQYEELAERERQHYKVVTLANDAGLASTVERVISQIHHDLNPPNR